MTPLFSKEIRPKQERKRGIEFNLEKEVYKIRVDSTFFPPNKTKNEGKKES